MTEHSAVAEVAVSNSVNIELIAHFTDCNNYSENSGIKFWVTNANKYRLLALLAQVLLSAPASEAYVERVLPICGEPRAGKRNRLTKSFEKRIMLIMSLK